jgi:hypothetical protein
MCVNRLFLCAIYLLLLSVQVSLADVLVEDDFDGYSDEPSMHGWVQGSKVTVIQDGYSGRGVRCTFDTARSDAGNYVFARRVFSYSRSDLYVRFYFRLIDPTQAGTNQAYEGGCKFNKWFGINSDPEGYANTTNGLHFSTPPHLGEIGSGKGIVIDNDSQAPFKYTYETDPLAPLRNYELSSGNYIDFVHEDGVWHCMEMRVKFNSNGQRDGLIQQWMDGVEILRVTNVKNRHDNNSLYWGSINWFDYTHINTHTWYMDIDNVVISDEYIGPIGGSRGVPPGRPGEFKELPQ